MRSNFDERFRETKERERECMRRAEAQGGRWDFSNGNCRIESEDGRYRDFEEDRDYPFDCSLISCFEGQICSPYRGCVSFEEREKELEDNSNDYNKSYEGDRYQDCASDEFFKCEGNRCFCYKDNSGEFNVQSSPDYDSTRGGDGVSCNSGYESDGSGGCIPFGTGDYGFDDPNSASYSTNYDSSSYSSESSPESNPEPIPESASITGSFITGNAFLDYYFRWY